MMPFQTGTNVGLAAIILVSCVPVCALGLLVPLSSASSVGDRHLTRQNLLSNNYLENDLLAIDTTSSSSSLGEKIKPRLCVVRPDGTVYPLCRREDDVETDLFVDPREFANRYWSEVTDEQVIGTYGEGWYGQRPVPSLGGGPGYGAEADEIWSIDVALIEQIGVDGVDLPVIDMGIAHGEKARAGAF
jgi:hypothetical protein